MRSTRLAGLALVAVLVVSLIVASIASGAPEFKPTGATFTASGKHLIIEAEREPVECAAYMWSGEISKPTLAGNVFIRFLACTGKNFDGETCPVMSWGAQLSNLIATNTLHGVLGLVLPTPASGSDVALVLLPTTQPWLTILGSCIVESALEGSVAGLVEPVGVSSTTDKIIFGVTSGKQNIKDVDLSTGGLTRPKLTFDGVATATLESEDEYIFNAKVEVT